MRRTVAAVAALGVSLSALSTVLPASADSTGKPASSQAKVPRWKSVDLPKSKESLRGLAAVDATTAWVASDGGVVAVTADGGQTWTDVSPDTGTKKPLLFRDVAAASATEAQVLAIGERGKSRIYKTVDGGTTWTLTFKNTEKDAFYDCFSMFDDGMHGLAMSDPVDGRFRVIRTEDGGDSWSKVSPKGMPKAKEGEFAFAASGTCLQTYGDSEAWIVSGGAAARVFRSVDGGLTWKVAKQTIPAAEAGGIFSVDFNSARRGIAVGGDFEKEDEGTDASTRTGDGGKTWRPGGDLGGYRSGVAWLPGENKAAVAVGPSGADYTTDGGKTWKAFGKLGFHGIQCTDDGACWASGTEGAVALLKR